MVRVIDDMVEVHRLQKAGTGWEDDMALVSENSPFNYNTLLLDLGIYLLLFLSHTVSGSVGTNGESADGWRGNSEGEWNEVEDGPSLPSICPWRAASR